MAQLLALGIEDLLRRGKIVELFPDWPGERFPLYVLHLSRHVPPAKVRAFLDFVVRSVRWPIAAVSTAPRSGST